MPDTAFSIRPAGRQRPLGWWLLRALGAFGILILIALLAGWTYQTTSERYDAAAYPMAGGLIEADGVRLHLHCMNDGAAGPTIILLTGMGSVSSAWNPVMRDVATDHRVCAYDRDGTGWSDDSGKPRDAGVAAARLAALLDAAGITGPVVLAAHSYGGIVARVFTHTYPDRVSGLVLVDSSHQDMGQRFPPEIQGLFDDLLASFGLVETLHHTGLPRALSLVAPAVDGLEGTDLAASMSRLNTISHMHASAAEAEGWERSAALARQVQTFGDLPLHVLVADDWPEPMLPSWLEMQRELAALSSRGRFDVVAGANHSQIAMDARYAPRVAAAIRGVTEAAAD